MDKRNLDRLRHLAESTECIFQPVAHSTDICIRTYFDVRYFWNKQFKPNGLWVEICFVPGGIDEWSICVGGETSLPRSGK